MAARSGNGRSRRVLQRVELGQHDDCTGWTGSHECARRCQTSIICHGGDCDQHLRRRVKKKMSSTTTTTTTPIKQGVQYGFFYDQSRCIGCGNCFLACNGTKQPPIGQVRLLRLYQWEKGTFPNVTLNTLWAPCYQCVNPVCVTAANGALIKEPTTVPC